MERAGHSSLPSEQPLVSVVVPVLEERAQLDALVAQLAELRQQGAEVIVVDGGSNDGSVDGLRQNGFTVLPSEKGRAVQMHTGARAAQGEVLLFLHADTRLPADALQLVQEALSTTNHVWGRFDVRIDGTPWMLKVVARMMNWRSRWSGIGTGDQAMFVTQQAYQQVGGFPQQPLMEDVELSKRLKAISRPLCLRAKVRTSGRRWERYGVWRTIWLMWKLRWLYWRGVSAEELAAIWRKSA